jgi:hypothetical protein
LLILGYAPLAMLSLGDWWRQVEAGLWPRTEPESAAAPGEVPLADLVRDVLWRLDNKAAHQFARLEMAVAEGLVAGGDRQVVDELLSTLCLHAIQSTPCGNVLLTARRHGEEIVVRIVDDGIGIATVPPRSMRGRTNCSPSSADEWSVSTGKAPAFRSRFCYRCTPRRGTQRSRMRWPVSPG